MKRLLFTASLVLLASLVFHCAPTQAAQGGGRRNQDPVQFILQHSKDLSITDEQKTKLDAIEKEITSARPARGADRTEYTAKMKDAGDKATAILTKEQQDKLTTLKEKAAADKKPAQ